MPLLARMIRQRRAWVQLGGDMPDDMAFPVGVIADLYDARGGTSFWLVNDREGEDVRRLVAHLSCATSARDLSPTEIRFVDEEAVKRIGIRVEATKGNEGPDKGLSSNHRDLHVQTNGQAIDLAKEMLRHDPIIMTIDVVTVCIAESVERGYFGINVINPNMLKALAKAGAIRMKDLAVTAESEGGHDIQTEPPPGAHSA
jgi:hypothetical protein